MPIKSIKTLNENIGAITLILTGCSFTLFFLVSMFKLGYDLYYGININFFEICTINDIYELVFYFSITLLVLIILFIINKIIRRKKKTNYYCNTYF